MADRYLVFNIGCIECGVSSGVVGVFDDIKRADELAKKLNVTHAWREGGQNAFEVFRLPPLNQIDSEYLQGEKADD